MAESVDPKDPATWPSANFQRTDWPRLTETLAGVRAPDRCQRCSTPVYDPPAGTERNRRQVWQECDGSDQPEVGRYVVLCRPCANEVIEPHPRLYTFAKRFGPNPGAMLLCGDCRHRDGVRCGCPAAALNGGPGIVIHTANPTRAHVQRAGPNGRGRRCSWETWYPEPPRGCSGKEAI